MSELDKKNTNDPNSFKTRPVALLALVHFIHDSYTSFLAPALPVLIQRMGLSLTQAGSLTVFLQFPSLFNPFLGMLADKKQLTRLFLALAPGLTAALICLIGFAPSYAALAMVLLAAGISVAMMHVSGPVIIARLSGKSVGRGMGFFMLGGELARTAGPILTVWALAEVGLEGLWKLIPVGIVASLAVWWRVGRLPGRSGLVKQVTFLGMLKEMRFIFTGVLGIMVARAFMSAAITTYLPTYLFNEGASLWLAGLSLSVYEAAGAAGVFISGWISDRLGRRMILTIAILAAPGLMLAVAYTQGPLLFASLLGLGFTILASGPVMMALVIENAGENQSAANGLFMAISFAVRSGIVLIVGFLGDTIGLQTAFVICAALGVLGLPFVLLLPRHKKTAA